MAVVFYSGFRETSTLMDKNYPRGKTWLKIIYQSEKNFRKDFQNLLDSIRVYGFQPKYNRNNEFNAYNILSVHFKYAYKN